MHLSTHNWMRAEPLETTLKRIRKLGYESIEIAGEPLNRFETYLFNRAAQALALADAVSPDCGVCLDAFHLNIEEENMYDAIRLAGKRLFDFHVADNNRFACGLGQLKWKKIVG